MDSYITFDIKLSKVTITLYQKLTFSSIEPSKGIQMNNDNNIDILARKGTHLARRYIHRYDKNEDSKLLL